MRCGLTMPWNGGGAQALSARPSEARHIAVAVQPDGRWAALGDDVGYWHPDAVEAAGASPEGREIHPAIDPRSGVVVLPGANGDGLAWAWGEGSGAEGFGCLSHPNECQKKNRSNTLPRPAGSPRTALRRFPHPNPSRESRLACSASHGPATTPWATNARQASRTRISRIATRQRMRFMA